MNEELRSLFEKSSAKTLNWLRLPYLDYKRKMLFGALDTLLKFRASNIVSRALGSREPCIPATVLRQAFILPHLDESKGAQTLRCARKVRLAHHIFAWRLLAAPTSEARQHLVNAKDVKLFGFRICGRWVTDTGVGGVPTTESVDYSLAKVSVKR